MFHDSGSDEFATLYIRLVWECLVMSSISSACSTLSAVLSCRHFSRSSGGKMKKNVRGQQDYSIAPPMPPLTITACGIKMVANALEIRMLIVTLLSSWYEFLVIFYYGTQWRGCRMERPSASASTGRWESDWVHILLICECHSSCDVCVWVMKGYTITLLVDEMQCDVVMWCKWCQVVQWKGTSDQVGILQPRASGCVTVSVTPNADAVNLPLLWSW